MFITLSGFTFPLDAQWWAIFKMEAFAAPLLNRKRKGFKLMTLSFWMSTNRWCLEYVLQILHKSDRYFHRGWNGIVMSGKCQVYTSSLVKSNNETFFPPFSFVQIFSPGIMTMSTTTTERCRRITFGEKSAHLTVIGKIIHLPLCLWERRAWGRVSGFETTIARASTLAVETLPARSFHFCLRAGKPNLLIFKCFQVFCSLRKNSIC